LYATDLIHGQDLLLPASMVAQVADAMTKKHDDLLEEGQPVKSKGKGANKQDKGSDKTVNSEGVVYVQGEAVPEDETSAPKKKQTLLSRFFGGKKNKQDAEIAQIEVVGMRGPLQDRGNASFVNNDL
jgi:hypothetical protein